MAPEPLVSPLKQIFFLFKSSQPAKSVLRQRLKYQSALVMPVNERKGHQRSVLKHVETLSMNIIV